MTEIVKVSSRSAPNGVAGALAAVVRESGRVEIQVVGAGALNQAVKAIAIARSYLAGTGTDLCCRPTFADIEIGGEPRTAMRLLVEATPSPAASASAGPRPAGPLAPVGPPGGPVDGAAGGQSTNRAGGPADGAAGQQAGDRPGQQASDRPGQQSDEPPEPAALV